MTEAEIIDVMARATFERKNEASDLWDRYPDDMKEGWRNLQRPILAALRAHGMEVVPVEPTEAMIEAAFNTMTGRERDYGTTIKKEWAAMITAATPTAGK